MSDDPPRGLRRSVLKLRRRWDRRFRILDFFSALVLGLGLDWLLLLNQPHWAQALVRDRSDDLFTTGAAVTGVLLGLTLTSLAIISDHISAYVELPVARRNTKPAVEDKVVIREALADQLVGAFISATAYLGLSTVLALAGLIPTGTTALKDVLGAWMVTTVISVGAVARCTSLLGLVVRAIIKNGARRNIPRDQKT